MDNKPVLIVREGQLEGQRVTLDLGENEYLIGRGGECDLVLPERQVSRVHLKISKTGDRYMLHDQGSKNGTHINGQKLTGSTQLKDGDKIQIALCVTLMFVGTEATLPLTWEEPVIGQLLEVHEDLRNISVKGQTLNPPLSLAQFRLIGLLFDADGAVVSRDQVVEAVWPGTDGMGVTEQAIDALVRRLRDRMSELSEHNFVVTVRGHGFRLDNPTL